MKQLDHLDREFDHHMQVLRGVEWTAGPEHDPQRYGSHNIRDEWGMCLLDSGKRHLIRYVRRAAERAQRARDRAESPTWIARNPSQGAYTSNPQRALLDAGEVMHDPAAEQRNELAAKRAERNRARQAAVDEARRLEQRIQRLMEQPASVKRRARINDLRNQLSGVRARQRRAA